MVHKFSTSIGEIGSGTGALFKGMTPITTLPVYFGTASLVKGTMKRAGKTIKGKKGKKKMEKKKKKKH